jgi:hypothetical protein
MLYEVDENGYPMYAVRAWGAHGLYPPPILGDASNPKVVELHRSHLACLSKLPSEEKERIHGHERQFAREFYEVLFQPAMPTASPASTPPSRLSPASEVGDLGTETRSSS